MGCHGISSALLSAPYAIQARSDPQLRVTGALIVAARFASRLGWNTRLMFVRHGVHWSPLTLPPTPRPRQPKNKRLQWVYHGAHYSAKSMMLQTSCFGLTLYLGMTSFDHVYPLRMTTTARLTAADGISPFKVLVLLVVNCRVLTMYRTNLALRAPPSTLSPLRPGCLDMTWRKKRRKRYELSHMLMHVLTQSFLNRIMDCARCTLTATG